MTEIEKHPLIPKEVEVQIPQDRNEADTIRRALRPRLDRWIRDFGPWPDGGAVHLNVESERHQYHVVSYRELSVTYEGERGEAIPAYLLIPTVGKAPYPAVVANHQCNQDCDIGKDAVVGKAHLRPDQAYAFELVLRGYVVLAPDSINCGLRNIPGVRKQGENNRDKNVCFDRAIPTLNVDLFGDCGHTKR